MKNLEIANDLIEAGINYKRAEYGDLIQLIKDAIFTVNELGKDFWLEETTVGPAIRKIVLKYAKNG